MNIPPKSDPSICEYAIADNGIQIPLLVDLPHGGGIYPDDFQFSCPKRALELCEERHLDTIFMPSVMDLGGVTLKANFPRTYVDVNRTATDIDQLLFDTPWTEPTTDKGRSAHGHGVIMRMIRAGEPIYTHSLTHAHVHNRLDNYYFAYHEILNYFSNIIYEQYGVVYHLNCHSMPSSVVANSFPQLQPDFILGDLDGRSCGIEFRQQISEGLKDMGYRVAINQLYKGAEIINRYGQPAWGRHSLQIEINRALFQDETTSEKNKNYDTVRADIQKLLSRLSFR